MRIGAFVGCFGIFVCIVVVFSWPMRMGPHLHRIHIQLTVAHCLHVWSSFWSQCIVLQPERSMAAQTQRLLVDTVKGKPHAPQQLVWLRAIGLTFITSQHIKRRLKHACDCLGDVACASLPLLPCIVCKHVCHLCKFANLNITTYFARLPHLG